MFNKPQPSKLFKLKEWLTLPEAARHLSIVCEEDITEADILRLALDGHLTISVNLVDGVYAKETEWIDVKNTLEAFQVMEPEHQVLIEKILIEMSEACNMNHTKYGRKHPKEISKKASFKKGVWDLPLLGEERISIISMYEELSDIPLEKASSGEGAYIEREGKLYAIQDYFGDYHGYNAAYNKQFDKVQRLHYLKTNNRRKEHLLSLREAKLKPLREAWLKWNNEERFYPAISLPEDSYLVIRKDVIREFEQLLSDNDAEKSKSNMTIEKIEFTETERQSVLKLILGMAIDAYGYDPQANRNNATGKNNGSIKAALQKLGLNADEKTISKFLTEAAERFPDVKPHKSSTYNGIR